MVFKTRAVRGVLWRDEPPGAKSRTSLDGLSDFATQRIARQSAPREGSAQNGRLTQLLLLVCQGHTAHQAGTPSIPFWTRTRMAGVLNTILKPPWSTGVA